MEISNELKWFLDFLNTFLYQIKDGLLIRFIYLNLNASFKTQNNISMS